MFANKEGMQSVDLKAIFTKMLKEVKWESLKTYINNNADLAKRCTMGGFRMDEKYRPRMQDVILRDAERGGFTDAAAGGVFTVWYPVHETLHKNLEDHFNSEEYKTYRTENGLAEDEYVLTPEKFQQFFDVKELMAWKILLCFSPLKFSDEQAKVILDDKQDNAELAEKLAQLEQKNGELQRKVEQLQQEAERLRARQQTDAQEILNFKKENRQVKLDCEQYQKRAESALAEMRRTNEKLAQAEIRVTGREAEMKQELERVQAKAQASVEAAKNEMVVWRSRHEQQCQENHLLEEQAQAAEARCSQAQAEREAAVQKLEASHNLIDSLLARIDWKRVVGMKASPVMAKNLRSLMQNLTYDSGRNLTLDTALPIFWTRLSECEKQLILAIAKSSDRELASGSIKDYWAGLEQQFAQVQTSIEARQALLSMMQEIFYQTYTEEDLRENKPLAAEEEPEEKKSEKKAVKRKATPAAKPVAEKEKKTTAATAKKEKETATKEPAKKGGTTKKTATTVKKPATKKTSAKKTAD